MSKTVRAYCIRPLTVAIMLTTFAAAMAQEPADTRPTVTIAVSGKKITDKSSGKLSEGVYNQLSLQIEEFIGGRYAIYDRSAEVQEKIRKELEHQRSGSVSDSTIKALNKQFGVQFLCIISVEWVIDNYLLTAKITNVETNRSPKTANTHSLLKSSADITSAAKELAEKLLEAADSRSLGGSGRNFKRMAEEEELKRIATEDELEKAQEHIKELEKKLYDESFDKQQYIRQQNLIAEQERELEQFRSAARLEAEKKAHYENFTTGQRWGTWFLNFIPGLGSLAIMDDYGGAITQWSMAAGAVTLAGLRKLSMPSIYENETNDIYIAPIVLIGIGHSIYNIYRSASYDKPQSVSFTMGQRFGTWFLNIIPGLGSLAIMDDWTGATIQWLLSGSGAALFLYESGNNDEQIKAAGQVAIVSNIMFNTYRSASYSNSSNVAHGKYGHFNVAALPKRQGGFMPYIMYSRGF